MVASGIVAKKVFASHQAHLITAIGQTVFEAQASRVLMVESDACMITPGPKLDGIYNKLKRELETLEVERQFCVSNTRKLENGDFENLASA